jgi:purine nucleosidase
MSRRALCAVLASAAVFGSGVATGCGSSGSTGSATVPVVVDTDLSTDDVIALLYLLRSPRVDVRAVTVAGTGLVHCPAGARNAVELLALAGRQDVPVACGRSDPLGGFNTLPDDWRAAADSLFGLELPRVAPPKPVRAVELLRRESPGATVVELAPMTNLAAALKAEPDLAGRIRSVVAMAGAVSVPGNVDGHPTAETNAWLDPVAMRDVLRSGVRLTLVPLDATNDVPVTPYVGDALKRYHYATPEATAVWDLVFATGMANGGTYFWDPLAAVAVADPGVLQTAARRIDVVERGADAGRTIASPEGRTLTLATGARRQRFERELLGTLLAGAPFAIARYPTATVSWDGKECSYSGPASLTAGRVVIDVVDRAAQPFQFVVVAIRPPHTLADLRSYVSGLTAPATNPPSWLVLQTVGTAPPHGDTTWVGYADSGTLGFVVVACAMERPPFAAIAAKLPVYASS